MGKALMRRVFALVVAYLLQVLTAICGLVFPFMLNRFWKYEVVLYCFLFGLSFMTFPVHGFTVSFFRTVLWGAITGYVAGLLTLFFTPFLEGQHFHNLLHGWRIVGMDFILIPVMTLCWLVGISFGLALLVQDRKILARQTEQLPEKQKFWGWRRW